MGRRKLQLEFIADKKKRVATFQRKKKSLEKAAGQLSTLCGVDVGIITWPTEDAGMSLQPTIWPPGNHRLVSGLLRDYKASDHHARKYDLDAYFKEETSKIEKKLQKMREEGMQSKRADQSLDQMSWDQLVEFSATLTGKIETVKGRLSQVKNLEEEWNVLKHYIGEEQGVFFNDMLPSDGVRLVYYDGQGNVADQRTGMTGAGASCSYDAYERMTMMGIGASSNHSLCEVDGPHSMCGDGLLESIPFGPFRY